VQELVFSEEFNLGLGQVGSPSVDEVIWHHEGVSVWHAKVILEELAGDWASRELVVHVSLLSDWHLAEAESVLEVLYSGEAWNFD
jgi:hypothetical protein